MRSGLGRLAACLLGALAACNEASTATAGPIEAERVSKAPTPAPAPASEVIDVVLHSSQSAAQASRLRVPRSYLHAEFDEVGEASAATLSSIQLELRTNDPKCQSDPACSALLALQPDTPSLLVQLAPTLPDPLTSERAPLRLGEGYLFGLQLSQNADLRRGQFEGSNALQPERVAKGVHTFSQWRYPKPPTSLVRCKSTVRVGSLCELQVEVATHIFASAEIPLPLLPRWPEYSAAYQQLVQGMVQPDP